MSIGSTIANTEDGFLFGELPPPPKDLPVIKSVSGSCLDLTEAKEERTEKWISEQMDNDNDSVSSSFLCIDASHFANSDDGSYFTKVRIDIESLRYFDSFSFRN